MSKKVSFVLGLHCLPRQETKFEKWMDGVHNPLLKKSKWLQRVTRYKLIPTGPVDEKTDSRYMNILEFENQESFEKWFASPEFAAAMKEKEESWPTDSFEIKWKGVYQAEKSIE
jgi:hypothetical protein